MRPTSKQVFYWLPRILAILGIVFFSLFALDVFVEYETLSEIVVALAIHLIPSFILIAITVIAWRWHVVGGLLFLLLGFFSIFFFNTYENPISFALLTLPPLLVGLLFLWEGLMIWVDTKTEVESV